MSAMVIACYRPKPGKEEELLGLVKEHIPALRAEGLVGDGPTLCGRAGDGTLVEVFSWRSQAAIDAAHDNPRVGALWARFAAACDYVPIRDVEGADAVFMPVTPVGLDH